MAGIPPGITNIVTLASTNPPVQSVSNLVVYLKPVIPGQGIVIIDNGTNMVLCVTNLNYSKIRYTANVSKNIPYTNIYPWSVDGNIVTRTVGGVLDFFLCSSNLISTNLVATVGIPGVTTTNFSCVTVSMFPGGILYITNNPTYSPGTEAIVYTNNFSY
jgi:hypothetical protein